MMQTAAVQKISEQNSPYKAMLDRAYMIGYTDATVSYTHLTLPTICSV